MRLKSAVFFSFLTVFGSGFLFVLLDLFMVLVEAVEYFILFYSNGACSSGWVHSLRSRVYLRLEGTLICFWPILHHLQTPHVLIFAFTFFVKPFKELILVWVVSIRTCYDIGPLISLRFERTQIQLFTLFFRLQELRIVLLCWLGESIKEKGVIPLSCIRMWSLLMGGSVRLKSAIF